MPSNHELFKLYTKELPSPDSYVDAAWSFLISSALQRRVWIDSGMQVWPNQYIFLVAPPGVGKSVTSVVQDLLSYWTFDGNKHDTNIADPGQDRTKMMFNVSASSTTYAKFVEVLSSTRTLQFRRATATTPAYVHASASFVLDEITSIFKRDAQDMMSLLLEGWGCTKQYSNETIGRGNNIVRNMCLNIIGGTQPDKFAGMRTLELISSGFTRRAIIVYENKSRHRHFLIPRITPDQERARVTLLAWIKKLHELYGPVHIEPAALDWLNEWFADERKVRVNNSPYLDYYYASKQLHVHKTAMALHFGESLDMTIRLPTYQRAIEMLERFEKNMHLAFSPKASTDIADVKADVVKLLENLGTAATPAFLYASFDRKVSFADFTSALTDLQISGRVSLEPGGRYKLQNEGKVLL